MRVLMTLSKVCLVRGLKDKIRSVRMIGKVQPRPTRGAWKGGAGSSCRVSVRSNRAVNNVTSRVGRCDKQTSCSSRMWRLFGGLILSPWCLVCVCCYCDFNARKSQHEFSAAQTPRVGEEFVVSVAANGHRGASFAYVASGVGKKKGGRRGASRGGRKQRKKKGNCSGGMERERSSKKKGGGRGSARCVWEGGDRHHVHHQNNSIHRSNRNSIHLYCIPFPSMWAC